jgi:3-hydroxyisobutyrate dehydrogenase
LFQGDYLASFGLDRCCEELAAVTALARDDRVPFELSEHVERVYRRALDRYGPVDGELLPIAMLEEQAGIRLRSGALLAAAGRFEPRAPGKATRS